MQHNYAQYYGLLHQLLFLEQKKSGESFQKTFQQQKADYFFLVSTDSPAFWKSQIEKFKKIIIDYNRL